MSREICLKYVLSLYPYVFENHELDLIICASIIYALDSIEAPLENKKYQEIYHQNEDKIVYDDPSLNDILTSKKYTCFDADVKKGVRHFNWEKSIENGFVPAKEDSLSLLEIEDVVEIPVFAYQPKKIVVSLYLEGWDRDNTELSVFGSFNASLSFKIKRSMQQR